MCLACLRSKRSGGVDDRWQRDGGMRCGYSGRWNLSVEGLAGRVELRFCSEYNGESMQAWDRGVSRAIYSLLCSKLIAVDQEWKWRETQGGLPEFQVGCDGGLDQDGTSGEGEKVNSLAYILQLVSTGLGVELKQRWPWRFWFEQTFVSFTEMGKIGEEIGLRGKSRVFFDKLLSCLSIIHIVMSNRWLSYELFSWYQSKGRGWK